MASGDIIALRGGTRFLELRGSFWTEVLQRGPVAKPPEAEEAFQVVYTLEKYFVRHTRCQNDETITLSAMLYKGGGRAHLNLLLGFASTSRVL